jgi:hypothetical protein
MVSSFESPGQLKASLVGDIGLKWRKDGARSKFTVRFCVACVFMPFEGKDCGLRRLDPACRQLSLLYCVLSMARGVEKPLHPS